MNEFELIDAIVRALGPAAWGGVVGPGDDCAAVRPPPDQLLVSSIDTLVAGIHFPEGAPAQFVGYRAVVAAMSDLAAMGAAPVQALVALTLGEADQDWALSVARGMRTAITETGGAILGGNLARGPRSITLSVHGFCPEDQLLTRSGARAGDALVVTGPLGAAAAAVAERRLEDEADPLTRSYFHPRARIDAGLALRGVAGAAIDISDGLLQDLDHLCQASGVGADLVAAAIPVAEGAELDHALHGGDDYELLLAIPQAQLPADAPEVGLMRLHGIDCVRIGQVSADPGIRLDGVAMAPKGYQHFH